MREVVIRSGVYGLRTEAGRVRPIPRGGRAFVSDEEAARLAALGVAALVDEPDAPPAPLPPEPSEDGGDTGTPAEAGGESAPAEEENVPAEDDADIGEAEEEAPASDEEEAARLERLTRPELEQMARDLGLDPSGAKNKRELAALIAAAEPVPDPDDAGIVS